MIEPSDNPISKILLHSTIVSVCSQEFNNLELLRLLMKSPSCYQSESTSAYLRFVFGNCWSFTLYLVFESILWMSVYIVHH